MRIVFFTSILFLFVLVPAFAEMEKCGTLEKPFSSFSAKVQMVSDGDTIDVKTSSGQVRRIRLLNIDTPETHFQGKSQGESGELAHRRLEQLLPLGSEVTIQYEDKPCDFYGRYLGLVFREKKNINLLMVKEGYAVSLCFAPNLKTCQKFIDAAKDNWKRGEFNVFRDMDVLLPHEFRYQKSGRKEAPYVGDIETGQVYPFEKFSEIEGLNRVFFLSKKDISFPFQPLP